MQGWAQIEKSMHNVYSKQVFVAMSFAPDRAAPPSAANSRGTRLVPAAPYPLTPALSLVSPSKFFPR
jgi:hypothetical protein